MIKRVIATLIVILSIVTLQAQELEWSVDMNAVFNNREGGTNETPDQTFIFTRLTPQIGVSLDSAKHRIMGGVTWYQPMSDNQHGFKVLPSLYYQYMNRAYGLNFKFGVIPNELNNSVPTFLRSDSINYLQPNIKGLVIDIDKPHFWFYSWLDWRQIRTNHRREAFDVTGQIGWKTNRDSNRFSMSAFMLYNHLAKSYKPAVDEGVVDHILLNPQLSCSHTWQNARINAMAGMLFSCDRDRSGENRWVARTGFIGKIEGSWKWLSLIENIYAGQQQMPLYEKYGSLLYYGDQYYHNKFYSRTDLVATILQKDFLNLEARLTFHVTDKTTAFWQQLSVRFFLDRNIWQKHKRKTQNVVLSPLHSQF